MSSYFIRGDLTMESFKDVALRWFTFVIILVLGIRAFKYAFDFSIVFNNEFVDDLIIAGICGVIIELISYYNKSKKSI